MRTRRYKSFYVTKEDQDVLDFLRKKLLCNETMAIRTALIRYARQRGYKDDTTKSDS